MIHEWKAERRDPAKLLALDQRPSRSTLSRSPTATTTSTRVSGEGRFELFERCDRETAYRQRTAVWRRACVDL